MLSKYLCYRITKYICSKRRAWSIVNPGSIKIRESLLRPRPDVTFQRKRPLQRLLIKLAKSGGLASEWSNPAVIAADIRLANVSSDSHGRGERLRRRRRDLLSARQSSFAAKNPLAQSICALPTLMEPSAYRCSLTTWISEHKPHVRSNQSVL